MDNRIPSKGGFEQDAFTGWRKVVCYMKKAGVAKKAKRQYNKRFRKHIKLMIKDQQEEGDG